MAVIGIITDNETEINETLQNIIYRAEEESLLKNPFNIKARLQVLDKELFFLVDLNPVYPPVYWFGFLLLAPFIIFGWYNWFLLLPFSLIGMSFFWSSAFYIIVLFAGIRKNGYRGKIKFLSKTAIIKRLM